MSRSAFLSFSSRNIFRSLIFFIILYYCDSFSGVFEPGGKPEMEIVNPGAEVIIGALVNIRERGVGLFGCGEKRIDGITSAEALKWAADELNKKIWSSTSPNVSIGLQIMDSCSRTRIATSQLTEFLPELMGYTITKNSGLPFKFGIIDDVGLGTEADVLNTLDDMNIPIVKTDININSQQEIVAAALRIIQELRWDHIAVVHGNSRYSTSMLRTFTKSMKKYELCVPWIINIENSVADKDYGDLANAWKSGIPVVSFLTSEKNGLLLGRLKDFPKPGQKVQLLFTDVVERDQLKDVPAADVQLLALVPLPEKHPDFETYFWRRSRLGGLRQEDELELVRRTTSLRKIQAIMDKLSGVLRDLMSEFCQSDNRICSAVLSGEARNMAFEELNEADWSIHHESYALMEYNFRNAKDHILLRKIMIYNKFKSVDVFETDVPSARVNCESDSKSSRPECNCLEAKTIRRESARNIAEKNGRNALFSKRIVDIESPATPGPEMKKDVEEDFTSVPAAFSSFRNPVNAILACLTILGSFFTLFTGQYFATFAALPNGGLTSGTSVIGYFILIGLFFLYVTNLTFILTPSVVICTIRRFGISSSYAVIFSGMMIKAWTVWKETKYEKVELMKPSSLIMLSLSFSALQVLFSGLWLALVPPRVHVDSDQWMCYPSGDLDSHLLVSMVYIIGILLTTAILAIQASAKNNNEEIRWILICSALVAVLFSCWGIAIATGVWQNHRSAVMNLTSATILLSCLYIPKMKAHSKLKKSEQSANQNPLKIVEEFPVITALPPYPLMLECNLPPSVSSEDISDSTYSNEAYSVDDGTESASVPFQMDGSPRSDVDEEPVTFSSFFDDIQVARDMDIPLDADPTQIVPSNLYSLDMFNNESRLEEKDHCEPGTNEFTPQHRVSSQLYLYPPPEWVP